MTFSESAQAMRRMADVLDKVVKAQGRDADSGKAKPMLEPEAGAGAAVLLCYIRDLVSCGNRENYDRGTLLVLLETISNDPEIFPCGIGRLLWAAENEDEE